MTDQTITGTLLWSPELRFTPSGTPVCSFSINYGRNKGDKIDKGIDCEAWESLGERIAKRDLQPGQYVRLTGYYKTRSWEDREGKKHSKRIFVVKSGHPLPIEQGVLDILNRSDEPVTVEDSINRLREMNESPNE